MNIQVCTLLMNDRSFMLKIGNEKLMPIQ